MNSCPLLAAAAAVANDDEEHASTSPTHQTQLVSVPAEITEMADEAFAVITNTSRNRKQNVK